VNAALHVLLVEDEPDIADMLRLFFDMQNYTFHHAHDGQEAVALASSVMPHVILMDITLPDTDGYALTLTLRSRPRTAHIPVIFLTKWDSRDTRLMGLAMGGDDYITKPFDLQELLLRIQNSVARAARDHLTDLRTGLPAAFMAREWLQRARSDPQQAIIEVTLENDIPYQNVYGTAAAAKIHQMIAQLLLTVVNHKGAPEDFVGYLDENQFVLITADEHAAIIADQISAVFGKMVQPYYSDADRQRGALESGNSLHPLMTLACRITTGERSSKVP
jgi:DNA-binding response OmpR family regulator